MNENDNRGLLSGPQAIGPRYRRLRRAAGGKDIVHFPGPAEIGSYVCGIYYIQEVETGRGYVGQSTDIRARWRVHRAANTELGRAIREKGLEAFRFEVLSIVWASKLDEYEQAWIEMLGTLRPDGFNSRSGGSGKHNPDAPYKPSLYHIESASWRAKTVDERKHILSRSSPSKTRRRTSGPSVSSDTSADVSPLQDIFA